MFRRSGRLYGNATQTIANDPDCFQIYTIVSIVWIELNSIQGIEVVSVIRVVCDRLGNVSIWSSRSSEHLFETTATIRTIIWKPADTNFVSGTQNCFWFCSETFCVCNKCFPVCAAWKHNIRLRAQETSWATMCPQRCVLVCQYLYSISEATQFWSAVTKRPVL